MGRSPGPSRSALVLPFHLLLPNGFLAILLEEFVTEVGMTFGADIRVPRLATVADEDIRHPDVQPHVEQGDDHQRPHRPQRLIVGVEDAADDRPDGNNQHAPALWKVLLPPQIGIAAHNALGGPPIVHQIRRNRARPATLTIEAARISQLLTDVGLLALRAPIAEFHEGQGSFGKPGRLLTDEERRLPEKVAISRQKHRCRGGGILVSLKLSPWNRRALEWIRTALVELMDETAYRLPGTGVD